MLHVNDPLWLLVKPKSPKTALKSMERGVYFPLLACFLKYTIFRDPFICFSFTNNFCSQQNEIL